MAEEAIVKGQDCRAGLTVALRRVGRLRSVQLKNIALRVLNLLDN